MRQRHHQTHLLANYDSVLSSLFNEPEISELLSEFSAES